jgi:hypothetical protein
MAPLFPPCPLLPPVVHLLFSDQDLLSPAHVPPPSRPPFYVFERKKRQMHTHAEPRVCPVMATRAVDAAHSRLGFASGRCAGGRPFWCSCLFLFFSHPAPPMPTRSRTLPALLTFAVSIFTALRAICVRDSTLMIDTFLSLVASSCLIEVMSAVCCTLLSR